MIHTIRKIAWTLFFLGTAYSVAFGENLNSLFDAIRDVEIKLEKEAKTRKKMDAALKKMMKEEEAGKGTEKGIDIYDSLLVAIKSAEKKLSGLDKGQEGLQQKIKEMDLLLGKIQGRSEDQKIKELSGSLKVLLDELRKVVDTGLPQKEAVELGGALTVDFIADPEKFEDAEVMLGAVELSANVNIADNLVASITLLAEEKPDNLAVDEAIAEWSLESAPVVLTFGLQDYGHGLISTHLISAPLINDLDREILGPGIAVNVTFGSFTPGVGMTFIQHEAEVEQQVVVDENGNQIIEDVTVTEASSDPAALLSLEFALLEESVIRTSGGFRASIIDVMLGTELGFGPATVDLEYYKMFKNDNAPLATGYYAGIAFEVIEIIEFAVRYDGASEDNFDALNQRIGAGVTVGLDHGIFCALDYGVNLPSEGKTYYDLTVELGVESTLKLPGFQRRDLVHQ